MGICFCCLSEGDKVQRVLDKFPAVPASRATDGALQKVIGRVVLAGQSPVFSPAKGRPCVYFHLVIEEEYRIEDWVEVDDGNGGRRRERRERIEWRHLLTEERFVDFYLQDGLSKVFVNGSNRGQCRVQSQVDAGGGASIFNTPPPGIQQLIGARMATGAIQGFLGWHGGGSGRTGRFRYRESSFDVNETLAALGVVTPATDPFTREPVKSLLPIRADILTEKFFEDNKWTDWDKRSWKDLCAATPSVLVSDNPRFTLGVQIAPVMVPAWMTTFNPGAYAVMYPGGPAPPMGAPMAPPMGAPMGAPMGYPPGGAPQGYQQQGYPAPGYPPQQGYAPPPSY